MAELIRLPDAAIVALRCFPESHAIAASSLGVDLPRVNRFIAHNGLTIAAVGPDEWTIVDEGSESAALVHRLETALVGHHAAVIDISGNRVRYRVEGSDALATLARGCALDLERLAPGDCAGTLLARAQIYLLLRDVRPNVEILPRRSFARYIEAWFSSLKSSHGLLPV